MRTSVPCPDCGAQVPIPPVQIVVGGSADVSQILCRNCMWTGSDDIFKTPGGRPLVVWGGEPTLVDDVTVITTVHLVADQTFSSTTAVDVTGLSFAVVQGTYYHFRFIVIASGPTITTGSQVGLAISVTKPATTIFATDPISTKMGWDELGQSLSNYIVTYEGLILPSANGRIQLQAATTFGTSTITLKQGSAGFLTLMTT